MSSPLLSSDIFHHESVAFSSLTLIFSHLIHFDSASSHTSSFVIHVMSYLLLLHVFACCITIIVVKPVVSQARAIIASYVGRYAPQHRA